MKPQTVTLIDLEGKPIPLREKVPLHYFLGEYAHIVDFTWQFEDKDYRIYIGSSLKIGEATNHYESLLPLILFLNDQLTFIRNGMWETLAIYQATLGRYWEVPWYEPSNVFMLEVGCKYPFIDSYGKYQLGYFGSNDTYNQKFLTGFFAYYHSKTEGKEHGFGNFYELSHSVKAYKPTVDDFIKHYPDVFSKLTPWKGE